MAISDALTIVEGWCFQCHSYLRAGLMSIVHACICIFIMLHLYIYYKNLTQKLSASSTSLFCNQQWAICGDSSLFFGLADCCEICSAFEAPNNNFHSACRGLNQNLQRMQRSLVMMTTKMMLMMRTMTTAVGDRDDAGDDDHDDNIT